MRNGWIVAGFALLVVHLGLYMLALRGADLSFALPLTAAVVSVRRMLARFYLREDVGTARWVGTLVITAGVAIVALGEARRSIELKSKDPSARPTVLGTGPPGTFDEPAGPQPVSPPSGRADRRLA